MSQKRKRPIKSGTQARVLTDIQASTPELWRVLFARHPEINPEDAGTVDFRASFSLGLGRVHARHLGVELTVHISGLPWLLKESMVVTYRMYFTIAGPCPKEQLEADFVALGTRVGPATLFPYVRETVASITAKTGGPITLPLVNWDEIFPSVTIPGTDTPAPPELLEPIQKKERPEQV